MPRNADLQRIRTLLDRDRHWAAYAIGDLDPDRLRDCQWHTPAGDSSALLLLYRGFHPPITFAMGDGSDLAPLFGEIDAPEISLHLRAEAMAAMRPSYEPMHIQPMWRMVVDGRTFRAAPNTVDVTPLDESDLSALTDLYEDGRADGEMPAFFHPAMLRQGAFRAVREGGDIVAAAGTHLFSPALGVCTIGNVYTRRDRRRQGLAARVTSAVVSHALSEGIPTIVLNVRQDSAGAIRVYEQLGFRRHCGFFEGTAVKPQ